LLQALQQAATNGLFLQQGSGAEYFMLLSIYLLLPHDTPAGHMMF